MSTQKILFTDMRHIQCGKLEWRTDEAKTLEVSNPPRPPRDLRAVPCRVPRGIKVRAEHPKKMQPLDQWKGWGRVIFDGAVYRSWHMRVDGHLLHGTGSKSQTSRPQKVEICAMVSRDGYEWEEVHACEIEARHLRHFDGLTFLVDVQARSDERYKLFFSAIAPDGDTRAQYAEYLDKPRFFRDERVREKGQRHCLFAAVSPDGLAWRIIASPLLVHMSDTDTTVYFDEHIGRYVLYTRLFRQGRRWIGRAVSDDCYRWGPVEPVLYPRLDEDCDRDFYLNGFSRYPGAGEYRLMFPMVYHRSTERSHIDMYSSDDGVAWHRLSDCPIVTPGEAGSWDSEFISAGKDLVPLDGDKVAIPYHGTPYPHKYPRWDEVFDSWRSTWVWWPRDRISSVVAESEGELWTVPISPSGSKIRVNCRTSVAGELRIGIEGSPGRSIHECRPIVGNQPGAQVTWGSSLTIGERNEEPIVLHIRMRSAQLYSLEFFE